MIPKIIHYCWFGKNPKPDLAKKCINSWGKYCKEYEVIEWNEDNFSITDAPLYVQQAYNAKKWAFVTDYVRLWALTKYGGIYMDTDVEVVKPLDEFLSERAFSGFEAIDRIPTGIMGCEKEFSLFIDLLHQYDNMVFLDEKGRCILETNVTKITNTCLERGLVLNGKYQIIAGFALYPVDVFCPFDFESKTMHKTSNTHTIHWFNASWWTEEEKKEYNRIKKLQRDYRRKDAIIHFPNRVLRTLLGQKMYGKLKNILKNKG